MNKGVDYSELAAGADELRETLRIMVASIKAEGFSEEQAREIVTGIFARVPRKNEEEDA